MCILAIETTKDDDDVACGACMKTYSYQKVKRKKTPFRNLINVHMHCVPIALTEKNRNKSNENIANVRQTRTHTDFASLCKYFIQQIKSLKSMQYRRWTLSKLFFFLHFFCVAALTKENPTERHTIALEICLQIDCIWLWWHYLRIFIHEIP